VAATPIDLDDDAAVVAALRRRDEAAFAALLDAWGPSMLRIATSRVPSRAIAEEVVSDTWLAVLEGIDRFEGRSSLKTWVFRILVNTAISRARKEVRSIPASSLGSDDEDAGPTIDPARFDGGGAWSVPPASWESIPEERLLGREARDVVDRAIAALPPRQAQVVTLRDVEGWDAAEVADALEVSEANQRVLLHRGRAKVRAALAAYLGDANEAA
jgi:RNA polymerase sigma-70 factor, ECF subfamily